MKSLQNCIYTTEHKTKRKPKLSAKFIEDCIKEIATTKYFGSTVNKELMMKVSRRQTAICVNGENSMSMFRQWGTAGACARIFTSLTVLVT